MKNPSPGRRVWVPMVNAWRGLLLGDRITRTFDHELSYYVIGSLLWSVAIAAVFTPLAVRSYRKK